MEKKILITEQDIIEFEIIMDGLYNEYKKVKCGWLFLFSFHVWPRLAYAGNYPFTNDHPKPDDMKEITDDWPWHTCSNAAKYLCQDGYEKACEDLEETYSCYTDLPKRLHEFDAFIWETITDEDKRTLVNGWLKKNVV